MPDIVERLRSLIGNYALEGSWRAIPAEAADEIEHLRHVNEELAEDVQTLRQFDETQRAEIERLQELTANVPNLIAEIERLREELRQRQPVDPFQEQLS